MACGSITAVSTAVFTRLSALYLFLPFCSVFDGPNQPIPKEINPEYSWEELMLNLKLQYFGHLIQRTDLLEKTLMLERLKVGEEGDDRG